MQTTPRCPDADDQKFIDLAAAHAPAWLLSRDRHILKLKKPLLKLGVHAALPEQWVPLDPTVKPG
jgi:predicted nucleic acid-binding protein